MTCLAVEIPVFGDFFLLIFSLVIFSFETGEGRVRRQERRRRERKEERRGTMEEEER